MGAMASMRTRPDEGLREKQRRTTAAAISEAAHKLISERSYEEVTIEDIAQEVGMSSRTFFRYYSSKEDVILIGYEEHQQKLLDALDERPIDEDITDAVRNALLAFSVGHERDRAALRKKFIIFRDNPSMAKVFIGRQWTWERLFVDRIGERMGVDPNTDMRPAVIAGAAMAAWRAAIRSWIFQKNGPPELVTHTARALDALSESFRSRAG
ncbi:MAG: TetR family transcriptional regulator [Actinobacteria bacterium]|nr:TetR family transcriptional regulator [Actinomycetota bacterium]